MAYQAKCAECGSVLEQEHNPCPCGGETIFEYNEPIPSGNPRSMWYYRVRLPVETTSPVTLGEGATPLIFCPDLIPGVSLWIKDETRNPTGSMKDRAMSVAFTKLREKGHCRTILLSAGGAGVAAAAYAARAGMTNVVVVPSDAPLSRLLLCHIYGSTLVRIDGTVEDVLDVVTRASNSGAFIDISTYRKANPFQAEAPKTIAYEIVHDLGYVPSVVVVPVGGGGTLASIFSGFQDIVEDHYDLPRMVGVQNRQFASLYLALQKGIYTDPDLRKLSQEIDASRPTATPGLRHAYPPDGVAALRAIRASHGGVVMVEEEDAVRWSARLAKRAGIWAEPSAAISLAAVEHLVQQGALGSNDTVVCIATGAGWRDLADINQNAQPPITTIRSRGDAAVDELLSITG
ncbi:MAG: pyridoxal-phosphate dependent enzyme [Firmicutes bacterium]|nr:pyridoxal-phosphate dependent enzyme [Bacillota bacterium]